MTLKETVSKTVWDIKYRYRKGEEIIDQSVEDTWMRVAKAVALAEKRSEQAHFQQAFYNILEHFQFLPGGRILAGAGTSRKVTLCNCFVMNIAEDSLTGIFNALEEGSITLQQGGGVGYDFSTLRPSGDLVKKTGSPASGPVSFMRIWDAMCSVMLSTGARRGAMMGVMRCDHPDIEAFIEAKRNPAELRHFNVSVMITDAFMKAVKNNESWPLVFPTKVKGKQGEKAIVYRYWGNAKDAVPCRIYRYVSAKELWEKIIRSAYDYAEPGVLFFDTINRMNNLWYRERINATNPCGEIPLPPYGACNLGAINLTQFVISPYTAHAKLDWAKIEHVTSIATRFLDDVVDISRYPLKTQHKEAQGTRRIGLGITGLADAFVMLNIRYGSQMSLSLAKGVMKRIADITWHTSIQLAREKGVFPFFKPDYLKGAFVNTLDDELQKELAQYGVRNSHHNTIAPTGTISLVANNVSNGIEPIYYAQYDRHVRMLSGETITFGVTDYAYQLWRKENKGGLPKAWVDTSSLTPDAHLEVQGAVQPFIDNAISKTINIPVDFPFEQLIDVYSKAYALQLKGCTIFRPNPVTGSVLSGIPKTGEIDHCCQTETG